MNKWMDFFFPRHCPICDAALLPGERICAPCGKIPQIIARPHCEKCGKAVKEGEVYCFDCLRNPRAFDRGFSLYEYKSIHDSVATYKNMGRPEYGEYYGAKMAEFFKDELERLKADVLIPIPLHPAKEKKRGYNQALILAEEISKATRIPVLKDYLIRPKRTKNQKSLGRKDRQNNMKKAFQLHGNDVKLETVILVDDIYTTGNTIGAAAAVLKSVGVEHVYFISLATGRGL